MRRCVAHKSWVPMPKVKVTMGSKVKLCLKPCCSYTTEANLMKLHRKIKHNEKIFTHMILVPMPKVKVTIRSEVKIVSQL